MFLGLFFVVIIYIKALSAALNVFPTYDADVPPIHSLQAVEREIRLRLIGLGEIRIKSVSWLPNMGRPGKSSGTIYYEKRMA